MTAAHNLRLAAYRLQAAIGGLTAETLGLGDVLGALEDMPKPIDPFSTIFRLPDLMLNNIMTSRCTTPHETLA